MSLSNDGLIRPNLPGDLCFNPCYSGCLSQIVGDEHFIDGDISFNPCYSGCLSQILSIFLCLVLPRVSILVIVDVSLKWKSM